MVRYFVDTEKLKLSSNKRLDRLLERLKPSEEVGVVNLDKQKCFFNYSEDNEECEKCSYVENCKEFRK